MRLKSVFIITLLLFASAVLQGENVIRHPNSSQNLEERVEWGLKQVAGKRAMLGYSVDRLAYPNEFVGTFYTERPKHRSLLEILTGREVINPFLQGSTVKDTGQQKTKVWKETAILFHMGPGRGFQPSDMDITDIYAPINMEQRRLIWLGKATTEESVAFLQSKYRSSQTSEIKGEYIAAIGIHKSPPITVPVLQKIMNDESDNELRGEAAFWIAQQGDEGAIRLLKGVVESETSSDVIEKALVGIHSSESPLGRQYLREWTGARYKKELRLQALFWLGQSESNEQNAVLLETAALEARDSDIQEKAIFSLSQMKQELFVPRLSKIARTHPDREARKHAIFWLAQEASRKSKDFIGAVAFNDKDTEVQKHAVFALYELDNDEGIPELIRIARTHPNIAVRKQAIFWLGESGDERATDALLEILKQ